MSSIARKLVTDENGYPVAVQIDYGDWLKIEESLDIGQKVTPRKVDLSRFRGVITLSEDPLAYQIRIRGEWD